MSYENKPDIHPSTATTIASENLTLINKLDVLQRMATNHHVKVRREAPDKLFVLDEVFLINTRRVRETWVDASDWSSAHLKMWLGY